MEKHLLLTFVRWTSATWHSLSSHLDLVYVSFLPLPFSKFLCQPLPFWLGFSGGSAGKESTRNVGDLGLTPGLRKSSGEGNGYPLQYSGLENSTGCIVHGVAKSQMQLSDFHFQEKRNLTVFLTDSVHRHHGCCRVKTTKELEAWANWRRCDLLVEAQKKTRTWFSNNNFCYCMLSFSSVHQSPSSVSSLMPSLEQGVQDLLCPRNR